MAFPENITTFPQLMDITAVDGPIIEQYNKAMLAGDLARAKQILDTIPNGQRKIVNADYFNTIVSTLNEVQRHFAKRYNPGYIVSREQPQSQEPTDFWFQIVD